MSLFLCSELVLWLRSARTNVTMMKSGINEWTTSRDGSSCDVLGLSLHPKLIF